MLSVAVFCPRTIYFYWMEPAMTSSVTIALGLAIIWIQNAESREYCWESFNATCPQDKVVVMKSAKYGRMSLGKCLTRDYYTGCSADVLMYMDRKCSGRHQCHVHVPDTELHKVQPCPKDLMAYMEAEFTCLPVVQPPAKEQCHPGSSISDSLRKLTSQEGYISSMVTEKTLFGSPTCPWTIELKPGQRVNITLFDFAASDHRNADESICTMYASIKEQGVAGTQIKVCGGGHRIKPMYISDTNVVELQIMPRQPGQMDNPHFILHYQAVGCGPIEVPEGGWSRRKDNRATVACNSTGETWHVVCDGLKWVGDIGNCSAPLQKEEKRKAENPALPYGLILAVVIGIVLGVVIGVCLLSVVVGCQRRIKKKQRSSASSSHHPTSSMCTIDKQRMLRTPEYGYAHVWELQQLQGDDTIKTVDVVPFNPNTGGHIHISHDHKYESPQFLRIDNTIGRNQHTRAAGYYPDFDLDTQITHPECEAHTTTTATTQPVHICGTQQDNVDEQRYTN